MAAVAEIVVRFGNDVIAVTHVPAGGSFRVGSAPDADLVLATDPFALVASTREGFVVRAFAAAPPARLTRETRIEIAIDRVGFAIALVERPARVARARIELRPIVFAAASLATHLALWSLAMLEPEPPAIPAVEAAVGDGAMRLARYAAPAQTVHRARLPPPEQVPITTAVTAAPNPTIEPPEKPSTPSQDVPGLATPGRGAKQEVASADRDDRGTHHFDPAANPDLDTIKSGAYSTIATGRAAGEHYGADARRRRLIVVSCDEASCLVIGGDSAAPIRRAVERRLSEITACYRGSTGGKLELDFGLTSGGTVDDLAVGGIGDAGSCVAKIFQNLKIEPE
jgi:hypothetical protein